MRIVVEDRGIVDLIDEELYPLVGFCRIHKLDGILAELSNAQQEDRDVLLPGSAPAEEVARLSAYLLSLSPHIGPSVRLGSQHDRASSVAALGRQSP